MQQYFSHVRLTSHALIVDTVGRQLPDLESASNAARELIAGSIKGGNVSEYKAIEISDADFHLLDTVTVREVLHELGETAQAERPDLLHVA